jgi:hypothetical protein
MVLRLKMLGRWCKVLKVWDREIIWVELTMELSINLRWVNLSIRLLTPWTTRGMGHTLNRKGVLSEVVFRAKRAACLLGIDELNQFLWSGWVRDPEMELWAPNSRWTVMVAVEFLPFLISTKLMLSVT